MKKKFQIFSIFIFFILNNCSLSFQSIMDGINYSKNSVDFLSYVATDKTTTDHALSYFFDKDCSLSRTLQLKQICEEIKKESLTKKNVSNSYTHAKIKVAFIHFYVFDGSLMI